MLVSGADTSVNPPHHRVTPAVEDRRASPAKIRSEINLCVSLSEYDMCKLSNRKVIFCISCSVPKLISIKNKLM